MRVSSSLLSRYHRQDTHSSALGTVIVFICKRAIMVCKHVFILELDEPCGIYACIFSICHLHINLQAHRCVCENMYVHTQKHIHT